jgi:hypothetical protein
MTLIVYISIVNIVNLQLGLWLRYGTKSSTTIVILNDLFSVLFQFNSVTLGLAYLTWHKI